ncbi:pyridoxal-phosphate dependent enzyme [Alsobacter sp. SYSU M60028]|uniref:Pyridoxal-phosphate dependent enzyme n=1 Tax=Alsobacter ponti TaxID=2962936 RepID=A0ABT1LD20_9HYPH|nr:pyridoxal-phosphate dependent enzyme [Alsobacter ponti]MCP8938841.1 pyridoxal-phosphate dependent enzyme [Alsobacter ponti]
MSVSFDVSLSDVEAARARIAGRVRRTPAWRSPALSARFGRDVTIKLECLQLAGSFKVRGVANKLLGLTPEERARGVVAVSGGNHAIAVARGAAEFGVDALVLMPTATARFNVELTRGYGARVEFCETAAEAFAKAETYAAAGRISLHAYDDPVIIAGNGTTGLEFAEDAPDLSHVFVAIGGGGFAAGVAAAIKGRNPAVQIHGVETEGAETMTAALAAGRPVTIKPTSIARTLGAPFVTERTLAAARALFAGVHLVPDAEAVREMRYLLQEEKVLCEPAAASTVAAAARLLPDLPADARIGLVLCGSNIALDDVEALSRQFGVA